MPSRIDRKVHNRILEVMAHTTRYAFKGRARLAQDAGVSRSAITRLVNSETMPSWSLLCAVVGALERHVHRRLDPREIVSFDGGYPTPSVCDLVGCKGCLPTEAYDENDDLRDEYRGGTPGGWSTIDGTARGTSGEDR